MQFDHVYQQLFQLDEELNEKLDSFKVEEVPKIYQHCDDLIEEKLAKVDNKFQAIIQDGLKQISKRVLLINSKVETVIEKIKYVSMLQYELSTTIEPFKKSISKYDLEMNQEVQSRLENF